MFNIIAAIGKNGELGKDNQLVFKIKEDMQFFRTTTTGHPVIMGRKTFESIGRPLPNRTNYVVTSNPSSLPVGAIPITDLSEFTKKVDAQTEEYFIIGGASIYQYFLPHAKTLYLTEINSSAEADTFFPSFDKSQYHREVIKEGHDNNTNFQIVKYVRKT